MNIPQRIFLDTNVVNFILDHGGCIFEDEEVPPDLPVRDIEDVEALRLIFLTGQRAHWELAVSRETYAEISATGDILRRESLDRWFRELWTHWRDCFVEDGTLSDAHASELAERFEATGLLATFPDQADRRLIAHAIAYDCDAFCTRDRRTILRHVGRSGQLPLEIISPANWGQRLHAIAGLF